MELIIASIVAFASTNIDDIFILMLFFGNRAYQAKEIIVGQYLGIGALIAVSYIGSLLDLLIDKAYIGFLGLVPVFIGVKTIILLLRKRNNYSEKESNKEVVKGNGSVFSVAAVTFANGGDNIGIYIPLFATLTTSGKLIMISIFLLMIALWCFVARYLSRHSIIAKQVDKYGHIVTPIVLILLGLYILNESGTYQLLNF